MRARREQLGLLRGRGPIENSAGSGGGGGGGDGGGGDGVGGDGGGVVRASVLVPYADMLNHDAQVRVDTPKYQPLDPMQLVSAKVPKQY